MTVLDHKRRVQEQFGDAVEQYVLSPGHAAGEDLDQLEAWTEGGAGKIALDVATGGGHTARMLARHYGRVVASDLTPAMLRRAAVFLAGTGVVDAAYVVADAEHLPFLDGCFDAVSCRIAPHHFADVARFVREVARILAPGGIFLLEDSVAPDDPALASWLNQIEKLRDHTHVRSARSLDWRSYVERAGMHIEAETISRKSHPFAAWLERSATPPAVQAEVTRLFRTAPPAAAAAFAIQIDASGTVLSYRDEKLLLKARRA